ncbi:MAG: hypothetical protein GY759_20500, partial [Chloroflexi bacterium]|nr:hypothetical protein [Chloroflexota bacterium]
RIELLTLSEDVGSHVVAPTTIDLTWVQPTDGSGNVDIWVAVDQFTNTLPTGSETISGNSYSAALSGAGAWYVHLSTVDSTGNQTSDHFGPWHAGTGGTLLQANAAPLAADAWRSSIRVDGFIDTTNGEWDPETELLGSDPRPTGVYDLFTTWDADYLYYGWQVPFWGPHGQGYIHLDTQPGGSPTAYLNGDLTLPFDADFVIANGFKGHTILRHVSGQQWETLPDPHFLGVHGGNGDTELRISRNAVNADGAVQIVASVMDESGSVFSVLPAALNPVAGPWATAYHWDKLSQDVTPNEGQPDAHHAQVRISSPDIDGRPLGPNSRVRYLFRVNNEDVEPLDQAALIISGSDGLLFESVEGLLSAQTLPQSDRWFIDLGTLRPGARSPITLHARIAPDLIDTDTITVTAEIQSHHSPSEPDLSYHSLSHAVDSQVPIVRINLPDENGTLRSGRQQVGGSASDPNGVGIARVHVQVNGGAWLPAQGHKTWRAEIDVPDEGIITLVARAIDLYGHVSELATMPITIDNTGPRATLDLSEQVLIGTRTQLVGSAFDPFPATGDIQNVQVQVDDDLWILANLRQIQADNELTSWYLNWRLPAEQGVQHTLRVRAEDIAGNIGPASEPTLVTIDSIDPTSDILSPEPGNVFSGDTILVWGLASDGWGLTQVDVSPTAG